MDEDKRINTVDDNVDTQVTTKDGIQIQRDELSLKMDDTDFVTTARKWIKDTQDYNENELHLSTRRKNNKKNLFGRVYEDKKYKDHESDFEDNIIWEAEEFLVPMAFSRLPDITVKPGDPNDENSKKSAETLTGMVNSDLQSRSRKKVVKLAFKHHPVYLVGAIKPFWNPEKGPNGDYDFKTVHPENLVIDHKAMSNDVNDMRFIAELCEYSVNELIMRFPKKKAELFEELRATGKFTDEKNEEKGGGLETIVKIWELHFTNYEETEDGNYSKLECTGWFYNKLCLMKGKTPNWDWKGQTKEFSYKEEITEDQYQASIVRNEPIEGYNTKQFFKNYLPQPEKPYILVGYDQWGEGPLDETSRIEQTIKLQKNHDKRGRQITELIDNARVKHIFSKDSGLTKEDLEEFDLSDPEQDLIIKGKVNEVHASFQGELPSPALINDKLESRKRIFEKYGTPGSVRGEVESDVATTNQIAREGVFTRVDDLADDTVNFVYEKMAMWMLHFIKLRYKDEHFKTIAGSDGMELSARITQDLVEDGQEVVISASGRDKLKAEQRATDMAGMKMIDPLTYFKDIGASDPKGRTEKLMMFMMQPELYLQKFVLGNKDATAMATALNGNAPSGGDSGKTAPVEGEQPTDPAQTGQSPQAIMDIAQLEQGVVPPVPNQIDEAYITTINTWFDTKGKDVIAQFAQQDPTYPEQVAKFMEAVIAMAQQKEQEKTNGATPNVDQFGQGGSSGGNAGPLSGGASPTNTNKMAATPPTV